MMKGGGNGAVALLVLLIAAALCVDVSAARPSPNQCTNGPNNPGHKCHNSPGQQEAAAQKQELSSPAVAVSKAMPGPNPCTFDPPTSGKKCIHTPRTAP